MDTSGKAGIYFPSPTVGVGFSWFRLSEDEWPVTYFPIRNGIPLEGEAESDGNNIDRLPFNVIVTGRVEKCSCRALCRWYTLCTLGKNKCSGDRCGPIMWAAFVLFHSTVAIVKPSNTSGVSLIAFVTCALQVVKRLWGVGASHKSKDLQILTSFCWLTTLQQRDQV